MNALTHVGEYDSPFLAQQNLNRALEDEADSLDHDLERLEEEKKSAEEAAEATKVVMAEAIRGLEQRMQQQEEAHERESEEYQAEKRCVEGFSPREGKGTGDTHIHSCFTCRRLLDYLTTRPRDDGAMGGGKKGR